MFSFGLWFRIATGQSHSNIDRRISLYDFLFGRRLLRAALWVFRLLFIRNVAQVFTLIVFFCFVGLPVSGINIFHGGVHRGMFLQRWQANSVVFFATASEFIIFRYHVHGQCAACERLVREFRLINLTQLYAFGIPSSSPYRLEERFAPPFIHRKRRFRAMIQVYL